MLWAVRRPSGGRARQSVPALRRVAIVLVADWFANLLDDVIASVAGDVSQNIVALCAINGERCSDDIAYRRSALINSGLLPLVDRERVRKVAKLTMV